MHSRMNWDSEAPAPRDGWRGALDRFVGPGATRAELWLQFSAALVAAIVLPWFGFRYGAVWGLGRAVIVGFLALDVVGGVVTNSTSSAKRWYHRSGQGLRQHLPFVASHAIQLLLVAWLFLDGNWPFFAIYYGFLLTGTIVLHVSPLYLRRPLAMALLIVAVVLDRLVLASPFGLEWFVPLFFAKLFVGHALYETPFRPAKEATS